MKRRSFISRLWPQTLVGQLVLLILGAVVLTHVVLGLLLAEERRDALLSERRGGLWRGWQRFRVFWPQRHRRTGAMS